MENINHAHAHVSTSTSDCDGPFYRDYTVFVSDEAKAKSAATGGVNDFWEIEFRDSILTSQVSVYTCESGTLQVSAGGFSWRETTDEGYRAADVRWCEDESCTESYSQRDIYAEMAGY